MGDFPRVVPVNAGSHSLLPLWEKVAVGGPQPPFFSRTPMLRIGYAKSAPDEGLRRTPIDRNPSPVSNFAEFIIGRRFAPTRWLIRATLSHKGRGEELVRRQRNLVVDQGIERCLDVDLGVDH